MGATNISGIVNVARNERYSPKVIRPADWGRRYWKFGVRPDQLASAVQNGSGVE
jgi:hypothetical protein